MLSVTGNTILVSCFDGAVLRCVPVLLYGHATSAGTLLNQLDRVSRAEEDGKSTGDSAGL
jgi:hypothetical protein